MVLTRDSVLLWSDQRHMEAINMNKHLPSLVQAHISASGHARLLRAGVWVNFLPSPPFLHSTPPPLQLQGNSFPLQPPHSFLSAFPLLFCALGLTVCKSPLLSSFSHPPLPAPGQIFGLSFIQSVPPGSTLDAASWVLHIAQADVNPMSDSAGTDCLLM